MTKVTMDVQWVLKQWGRWARQGAPRLGFPSAAPFRRMLGSSVAEPQISDEGGCYGDGLVSELSVKHPREAASLALTHGCGLPSRKVAGELRCSQKAAQELLGRAEFWVEGRMGKE